MDQAEPSLLSVLTQSKEERFVPWAESPNIFPKHLTCRCLRFFRASSSGEAAPFQLLVGIYANSVSHPEESRDES